MAHFIIHWVRRLDHFSFSEAQCCRRTQSRSSQSRREREGGVNRELRRMARIQTSQAASICQARHRRRRVCEWRCSSPRCRRWPRPKTLKTSVVSCSPSASTITLATVDSEWIPHCTARTPKKKKFCSWREFKCPSWESRKWRSTTS